jgi:hypothetical protein
LQHQLYKLKFVILSKENKIMSPQIIINKKGEQTGVILSLKDYNRLREMAEDIADIKAYDKAKARSKKQKLIPLQEVIRQRKQNLKNGK